jgi:Flp pilus assembly protein TadG
VTRHADERGSLAVEMAIIIPSLLLIFALIFAYGRAASVNGNLESATRDAARAATLARSYDDARQRVDQVLTEGLAGAPPSCRATLQWANEPQSFRPGDFQPGNPITVQATCAYSLSDLGLPGAPGTVHPVSSFTSMLDPYRGVG